jgi:2-phosphosulfolactate phosphatase
MDIVVDSLLEGARRARGTVVIVDVFRAFTTAAIAFSRGATKIIMVAEPPEALALREQGLGEFCVGEVNGIRAEGFDFGNSPFEMTKADLEGRTIIQSTRAGTVGVAAATGADTIYVAALVTAKATAHAILHDAPGRVTIVAMGWNASVRTDEDELCALYLRNVMQGREPDTAALQTLLGTSGEVGKFNDPAQPHFHPQDCQWALDVNHFDFAIAVAKEDDLLVARRCG